MIREEERRCEPNARQGVTGAIYDITFRAEDPHGGASTGLVRVTVRATCDARTTEPLTAQSRSVTATPDLEPGIQGPVKNQLARPLSRLPRREIDTEEIACNGDPTA